MTTDLRAQLQSTLGDGYTLERELGGGGMSRVFVARENALGREVVVKVLSPERAASLSAERFAREIKLAAALQDPHIVPVLAAGATSEGLPYYTMPFVRGDSLRARMVAGPVPVAESLGILRNIAQALAYAHERGIVHRDIKPENVLLSRGTAVVTDFGIAKALSASTTKAEGNTLTSVGTSIGTPAYMAPEQALGDVNTDARADLYAWGVVAYELLAGAHPFATRTTPQAMVAAHISETPLSLDAARLGMSRDMAALVMQCLAKDPAQRPPSADALLTRMVSATSGKLALAEAPSQRRTPMLAAGVVVAALAIAGWAFLRTPATASSASPSATATGSVAADSASPVRSLVVLPFESVGGDTANAYFAEGMADELSNALTKVPGLQLAGRSSAAAFRGKRASVQEIGKALQVGAVIDGTVRRAGGKLRVATQLTNASSGRVMWSETYEREATDVFAVQDDIAKAIASALRVTLAGASTDATAAARGTDDLEAYDLYQRGWYLYQRRAELRRAREYLEQAVSKDPKFVRAHAALSMTWVALAIYNTGAPMAEMLPKALVASQRAVALDSMSADAWAALGTARLYGQQWREADVASQRALQLDERNAVAHLVRARLLLAIGRIDDGVSEAQAGAVLDPLNASSISVATRALTLAGRHVEAVATGNRAWEMDSLTAATQQYSTLALLYGGQPREATKRMQWILSIHPGIGYEAAYVLRVSGDTARASAVAREYIAGPPERLGIRDWKLGIAWLAAGDTARALSALQRAVAQRDPGFVVYPLADQRYDPLRASARFAAIVRSLGLDVALFTSPNGGRPR